MSSSSGSEVGKAPSVVAKAPSVVVEPQASQVVGSSSSSSIQKPPLELTSDPFIYDWGSLKDYGSKFLVRVVLVACLGSFLFGFNLSLLNTSADYISWEYGWCTIAERGDTITSCTAHTNYKAFISTAVFIGAAIGSMTGGVFVPYGRRFMMLISMAVFALGIISSVTSNSFSALLWARLIVGYAVGLCSCVSPLYISEMCPADVRGSYGVYHQLFICTGILVGTLLGLPLALTEPFPGDADYEPIYQYLEVLPGGGAEVLPSDYGLDMAVFSKVWWRVMLGIGIVPVFIASIVFYSKFDFETPVYYVEQGKDRDAEELLKRLAGRDNVNDELVQIKENLAASERAKESGVSLGQAMSNPLYRWVVFYGALLSAFQQFGGINVFIASSNQLFQDAGLDGHWPTIVSNLMNLLNLVMTFPAIPLIEKLGRRTLLIIGTVGMTVAVGPAAICYWVLDEGDEVLRYLAIAGCLIFIVFFATTYGPVLWVYLFEIYPEEIRGAAAGAATAVNWIAGIVMVFVTAYLPNKISYTVFFIMCGISVLIVVLWMKETKGRALGDSPYMNLA